jgi:hypothetical protein
MDPEQVYKDHHANDERRATSDELEQPATSDGRVSDERKSDES